MEQAISRKVDLILISHAHPDHCADLNPILRGPATLPLTLKPRRS